MLSNNICVIIGRLGKDPECKPVGDGRLVDVNKAVTRTKDKTDWIPCKIWNKQADVVSQYCKKGSLVSCSGSIRVDSWTDKDNNSKQRIYLNIESVQLLDKKDSKNTKSISIDEFDESDDDIAPWG